MIERLVHHTSELRDDTPRVAIAMGVFDGVHKGHQAILQKLVQIANRTDAVPVALFFDPHPKAILSKTVPRLLTNPRQRTELLLQHGAERIVCLNFTKEMADMEPDDFLCEYFQIKGLTVTGFCVGSNFLFGRKNKGDALLLSDWASNRMIQASFIQPVRYMGCPISSTTIRRLVVRKKLDEASAMLGRPFTISGIVRHGNAIGGSRLDCPTANLVEPDYVYPGDGVYAAKAFWVGDVSGQPAPREAEGIVYVGTAPTIKGEDNTETTVELHLFDLDENLYGSYINVEFHQFIRLSETFASTELLAAQIKKDIAAVRNLFHP